jgi:hypothetical protein
MYGKIISSFLLAGDYFFLSPPMSAFLSFLRTVVTDTKLGEVRNF